MRPITKITILGTRLGVIALVVYWILIFIGTHIPEVPRAAPRINDKLMHFTAFFGLATFLCYVSKPAPKWKRFGRIAILSLCYAAIDEYTQRFVPRREPDWLDFAADAAGIATAISLYMLAQVAVGMVRKPKTASRAAS